MELLQEGVVGLLRALERYDPTRGTPFWPYAAWWVRQAMQQLVSELTCPVVLSDRALRQLARVRDAHRATVRETGTEPTREDLARRTGLTEQQIDDLYSLERTPRSTDEPIVAAEGAVGTFGDLLVDPRRGRVRARPRGDRGGGAAGAAGRAVRARAHHPARALRPRRR